MPRFMGKLETDLRAEERRHRDGFPSQRRDVADLLLKAADKIASLQEQIAAERQARYTNCL